MKFKATVDQIRELARLAVNASMPVGLGFLQFERKDYSTDDMVFQSQKGDGFHIDYFRGRMVKLHLFYDATSDLWETPEQEPDPEYQSWCHKYPTWKSLLDAAGVKT